jgi:hypothetical protein
MVINVPTSEDFFQSGKELLDFSWDVVAKLLTDLDEAEDYGIDQAEIYDQYWDSAKRKMTTALSITQQGIEFILKGKIAEISPYLLITDSSNKWPALNEHKKVEFSMFRTIDAQDLVRVHDVFSEEILPTQFVEKFNELRSKRNGIMHSVNKNIEIHVKEVIESLLFMHKTLFPNETWPSQRIKFLLSAPDAELGSDESATNRVCWELSLVLNLLQPAQVKVFFNIDKKQRKYMCPKCLSDSNKDIGLEHKLAELQPKGASSTKLYCPVCNDSYPVTRELCGDECLGNVMSVDGACLTCSV